MVNVHVCYLTSPKKLDLQVEDLPSVSQCWENKFNPAAGTRSDCTKGMLSTCHAKSDELISCCKYIDSFIKCCPWFSEEKLERLPRNCNCLQWLLHGLNGTFLCWNVARHWCIIVQKQRGAQFKCVATDEEFQFHMNLTVQNTAAQSGAPPCILLYRILFSFLTLTALTMISCIYFCSHRQSNLW